MDRLELKQKIKSLKAEVNSENGTFTKIIELKQKIDCINNQLDEIINRCENENCYPNVGDDLTDFRLFISVNIDNCASELMSFVNKLSDDAEKLCGETVPAVVIGE